MRVWFDNVNKRDARLLVQWWNGHSKRNIWYYAVSHPNLSGRWQVVRTEHP